VDTGLQAPGATLIDDMKAKGVNREDVDLAVLIHLHPGHEYWTQSSVAQRIEHITNQVLPLGKLNIMDLIDD
jgi:hypothetical protein